MLSGHNIICVSQADWFGNWLSKQEVMSRLAGHNRILYVNPQKGWRERRRRGRTTEAAVDKLASLELYTPPMLPLRGKFNWALKLDQSFYAWALKRKLKRLDFKDCLLWFYDPWFVFLLEELPKLRLVVYHYVDLHPALFKGGLRKEVERRENALIKNVDVVICCSEALRQRALKFNNNSHYISHGVDVKLYQKAWSKDIRRPLDLPKATSPIIGYLGSLNKYCDFNLLTYLADNNLDKLLVFVGQIEKDGVEEEIENLGRRSNVCFLGLKSRHLLPDYLAFFDVCVVIFDPTGEYIAPMSTPLKLLHYLAAGKPVVSTIFSAEAVRKFEGVVTFANSKEEFSDLVNRCLKQDNPDARERGIKLAEKVDWDKQVEKISQLVEQALQRKVKAT